MDTYTVSLCEGEHIQKLDICSGWFIEKLKLSSNLGKVFGLWGGEGVEERKAHRLIRKGVLSWTRRSLATATITASS